MSTKEPAYYRDLLENIERSNLTRISKFIEAHWGDENTYEFAVMDDEIPDPSFRIRELVTDKYDISNSVVTLTKVSYYYPIPKIRAADYKIYGLSAEFQLYNEAGKNINMSEELSALVADEIIKHGISKVNNTLKFAGFGPDIYNNLKMRYDRENSELSSYFVIFDSKNDEVNRQIDNIIGKCVAYQKSIKDMDG